MRILWRSGRFCDILIVSYLVQNDKISLSIVIPVYNEEGHLRRCLESITAQSELPDEVLVVDNNSTDQTVAVAKSFSFVKVLYEKRQGVLHASRAGYDAANCQLIGRIDADTLLEPNWVAIAKDYFAHNPDAAAITGNCYFYDFPFRKAFRFIHHGVYYNLQKLISGTEILWGSNMVIKQQAWRQVQSECLISPLLHEDIDLSFHLQEAGLLIRRAPSLEAEVSLRRGNFSPVSLVRYLGPWPYTYWLNRRHSQALAISAILIFIWLVTLPLSTLVWIARSVRQILGNLFS